MSIIKRDNWQDRSVNDVFKPTRENFTLGNLKQILPRKLRRVLLLINCCPIQLQPLKSYSVRKPSKLPNERFMFHEFSSIFFNSEIFKTSPQSRLRNTKKIIALLAISSPSSTSQQSSNKRPGNLHFRSISTLLRDKVSAAGVVP